MSKGEAKWGCEKGVVVEATTRGFVDCLFLFLFVILSAGCGSEAVPIEPSDPAPTHLFVADGRAGVMAIDIESRVTVAQLLTPGLAMDMTFRDDTAFVADFDGGLLLVDVSNPTTPMIDSGRDGIGLARDVALHDDYALVASYGSGLHVIDLQTRHYETDGFLASFEARGVVSYEGVAIVADQSLGLRAVSLEGLVPGVDHSRAPRIWDPDNGEPLLWEITVPGFTYAVAMENEMLYVAVFEIGVMIYDLSDRAKPLLVRTIEAPGRTRDVTVHHGIAYLAGDYGMWIIDVSNPHVVVELATVTHGSGPSHGVGAKAGYAAIADGADGMQFFDVSDPLTPIHLGTWDTVDANSVSLD